MTPPPPPPTLALTAEHQLEVEGFIRKLFWIFTIAALAFIFAGMMFVI